MTISSGYLSSPFAGSSQTSKRRSLIVLHRLMCLTDRFFTVCLWILYIYLQRSLSASWLSIQGGYSEPRSSCVADRRAMNRNKQGQVGLPLCLLWLLVSSPPSCPSLSHLLQFLWLWRACPLACQRLEVCVCVFVSWCLFPGGGGGRGWRSHADFSSGSVCVCALYVKWRQGENRGTRLYNGVRTQPASRSLHLSAAAPRHTHTHTHTLSWPTDLTRPAVICHLAANWAVSAGLLLASGSMVIPPFEGRPIQSHGWHCQRGLHHCDLYGAPANLSSTRERKWKTGNEFNKLTCPP